MSVVWGPQHKAWLDGVRQVDEERRAMALEARHEAARSVREVWAEQMLSRAFGGVGPAPWRWTS